MNQQKISHLLSQAGSAHHVFEQTVLKGVYDQDWPAWYANYVIEHGLSDRLGRAVTVELLARFLSDTNDLYEQTDKRQSWADFTAAKIAEKFV